MISKELSKYFSGLGKRGGKARANKYDKKTLKRWARMGGRPRKIDIVPKVSFSSVNPPSLSPPLLDRQLNEEYDED